MNRAHGRNDSQAGGGPGGGAKKKRRSRLRFAFLTLAALVAVSLAVAAMNSGTSDMDGQDTVSVHRGSLTVTVTESGSIRAANATQYKCQVERQRDVEPTILNIVPAGTYVTEEDVDNGMVLVELDSSSLRDRLQEEEMDMAGIQEDFTAAKESYDIQVIQNESDIAAGQLQVRFALLDLQKYLGETLAARLVEDSNQITELTNHLRPILEQVRQDPNLLDGSAAGQALKGFQDDIVLAAGNLKTAEDTLAGTERLHDAEYVSDLELERDRLSVMSRRFSEQNAHVSQDLFLRYDFPKNAEQYLSDYVEAERQLERTHARCRSRLAQAQASLSNVEERLHRQSRFMKELEQQVEYCTIRARGPGLVIYGTGGGDDAFRAMRGRGGRAGGIIAEGEAVYEEQTIISMPDTAAMVAEISVHETQVDKVRPGQPATIVMDAFPDRVLHGELLEIASLPDQQQSWMNPDLKVYNALVSIDGSHDFLKTRMSCRVEVLVRQLDDVLLVPIQVVANRGGRKVCYVATPDGPEEREVQTGAFTDVLVQIVDGLEESEQVLLNPPLSAATSSESAFLRSQRWEGRRATADANEPNREEMTSEGDDEVLGEQPPAGRTGSGPGGMRNRARSQPEGAERTRSGGGLRPDDLERALPDGGSGPRRQPSEGGRPSRPQQ